MSAPRLLLVFVDGLGIGERDPAINPIHGGRCPGLASLLDEHAIPIDACLGVPGRPQSATGQTTLLTGINAPASVGRHVEGFPGTKLRQIITAHSIFRQLTAAGKQATFANAYFVDSMDEVRNRRVQSVTTVAALNAFGAVRDTAALLRNEAVYQDITRRHLLSQGYNGPLSTPTEAAGHLAALAATHDMTLFEYFQTDRAGHAADPVAAGNILAILDEFVSALPPLLEATGTLLILTSDHGNIEDRRLRTHTTNPVPLLAVGPGASAFRDRILSLTDVTPAIVDLLTATP